MLVAHVHHCLGKFNMFLGIYFVNGSKICVLEQTKPRLEYGWAINNIISRL